MNILLADKRPRVRYALHVLFNQQDGWQVVGEAADIVDLYRNVQSLQPDLMVVSLDLTGLDNPERLQELRIIAPEMHIVALSEHPLVQMKNSGLIDACVSKYTPPERLLAVIQALNGRPSNETSA